MQTCYQVYSMLSRLMVFFSMHLQIVLASSGFVQAVSEHLTWQLIVTSQSYETREKQQEVSTVDRDIHSIILRQSRQPRCAYMQFGLCNVLLFRHCLQCIRYSLYSIWSSKFWMKKHIRRKFSTCTALL